jgi:hypothetical protein
MEKIKDLLGLVVHNRLTEDKFGMDFIEFVKWLERRINKKLGSEEGVSVAEEMGPLECRERKSADEKEKVYKTALRLLAEIRPEYKKHLPKAPKRSRKKKVPKLPKLLKRRIRLAVWVGTGNKIPDRELNVIKVLNLLKARGYTYRRGELKWYRGNLLAGKDLFDALEHLEKLEAVDRKLLTISF